MIRVTEPATGSVAAAYEYDGYGQITQTQGTLQQPYGYTGREYDPETGLTAPWGTVYGFGYDGEGRRTSLTSSSGRASSYAYENGLLSALTHVQSGVTLTNLAYEYGPDGQLAAILDRVDPSRSKTISYDNLNRLVQVAEGVPGEAPLPIEDYAYDEEGDRTASHLSAIYSSNDHNQLLEDADHTYTYDPKGNRTTKTRKSDGKTETYTYDSQNRLIGYTNGTTTASYAYDAMERRIAKVVDGESKAFVYDSDDLEDFTKSNRVLEYKNGTLARRWLFSNIYDEPLSYEKYQSSNAPGSGAVFDIISDRLKTILMVVAISTNAVAAEYDYEGYGLKTNKYSATEQPFGFTGREHDAESDLIFYRARHFDAWTGRFLQVDPIGYQSGEFNHYEYVSSDPLNFVDPSGLQRGTINRPNKGGGAVTQEFSLLNQSLQQMRTDAIQNIASAAFDLLMKTMVQARASSLSALRPEIHHCKPKSYGGNDNKSNLKKITRIRHVYVHKLMRVYMRAFVRNYKGRDRSMETVSGWSGAHVRRLFTTNEIDAIVKQFYKDVDEVLGVALGC